MANVPRRGPGVQTRVGKSTRGGDTRDARDDATIIAWLQRIDMDIIRAAKQPVPPRNPDASASPSGGTVPAPSTAFAQGVESAKQAVLRFADALNRPLPRIGDALKGTDATKEVNFKDIRDGFAGAKAPQIRDPRYLREFRTGDLNTFQPEVARAAGLGGKGPIPPGGAAPAVAASAGSAGSGLGAIALAAGGVTVALAGLAIAGTAAVVGIKAMGESILQSNEHLTTFSASMAMVFARQQMADTTRNVRIGMAAAESAETLQQNLEQLKNTLEPVTIGFLRLKNAIGALLVRIVEVMARLFGSSVGAVLNGIATGVDHIARNTEPKDRSIGLGEWISDIADQTVRERGWGKPIKKPVRGDF